MNKVTHYPDVCPVCKHSIEDFLGCVECNHMCMSYLTRLYNSTEK